MTPEKIESIGFQSNKILNEVFRKKPKKEVTFTETKTAQRPPANIPMVNISMLRQWLNEDRKCDPLVTNDDIIFFLKTK